MVDFKLSVLLGNVLQIASLASDFIYETSDFRKKMKSSCWQRRHKIRSLAQLVVIRKRPKPGRKASAHSPRKCIFTMDAFCFSYKTMEHSLCLPKPQSEQLTSLRCVSICSSVTFQICQSVPFIKYIPNN